MHIYTFLKSTFFSFVSFLLVCTAAALEDKCKTYVELFCNAIMYTFAFYSLLMLCLFCFGGELSLLFNSIRQLLSFVESSE